GYSGYVHEWMVDGRVDIAILHDARRSQHIAVTPLATARLFLVSHPRLLATAGLAGRESISIAELPGFPMALPSRSHGLRRTLDQGISKTKGTLDVQYELDTLTLMKEVVLAGIAHTVLAMPAIAAEVQSGALKATRLVSPELETRLMIATSLNRPLTREGRAVLAQIRPVLLEVAHMAPLPLHLDIH